MRAAFGPFSFDLCALELRKNGVRLRLEEKPARLLACLIERNGEVVTREELRKHLWPDDVNLDFDHGLNKAVNKLRASLGDSAADAKYLETLSKRGYRFIHSVELTPATEIAFERTTDTPRSEDGGTAEASDGEIPVPAGRLRLLRPGLWLAAVATVVALVPAGKLVHRSPAAHIGSKHIRVPAGLRLMSQAGSLALSPEGSRAIISAAGADSRPRLWLLDLNTLVAKELPGTDGGNMPFWSPDGDHVGFFTVLELKTIDLSNYSVKVLAPVSSARGGSWSAKGVILFAAQTRGPILRIPADGGSAIPVTVVDSESGVTTNRWPAFFPDGNHFVYLEGSHNAPEAAGKLMLGSLDGGAPKFLLPSDSNAVAGSDRLTFVSQGKLVWVSLNSRTLLPDGSANVLADAVDCDAGSWYCSFALNQDGVLYQPRGAADREVISWYDLAGKKLADVGPPGVYRSVSLSPDGKIVAVTCGDPDQKTCLIRDDGSVTRLDSVGLVSGSSWAPDSSAIAYDEHISSSEFTFRIKPVLQPSPLRTVMTSKLDASPIAWHPNGRYVLYARHRPGGTYDMVTFDLKTGETIPYLPEDKSEIDMAQFSPDGKWVALDRVSGGIKQIYIASYPVPSTYFPMTTEGGCAAKWRGDGKGIYYLGPADTLYFVSVARSFAGLRIGTATPLFRPPIFAAPWNCISFDVARNGSRFLINTISPPVVQELVSTAY